MEPARLWAGAVACCFRDLGEPSSPAQRRTEPDASTITDYDGQLRARDQRWGVLSVSCFLESGLPRPTIRAIRAIRVIRVIRGRTFFVEREQEHEPPFTIHRFPSSRLPDSR